MYAYVMSKKEDRLKLISSDELLKRIKDIEVRSVEEILSIRVSRKELENFLVEKGIDEDIVSDFLSRNWKLYLKSGIFT